MGERLPGRRLPPGTPRPVMTGPGPPSPRGDGLERGRPLGALHHFRPGQRDVEATADAPSPYGVRAEPHHLPQRAVVDPGRHGQIARLARQIGPVAPVEATARTVVLPGNQPGPPDITGRDDERPGGSLGQRGNRRVDATRLRLARTGLVPPPPRAAPRIRIHGERPRLHEHGELSPVPVLLAGVGRKGDLGQWDGQLGSAPHTHEDEHGPLSPGKQAHRRSSRRRTPPRFASAESGSGRPRACPDRNLASGSCGRTTQRERYCEGRMPVSRRNAVDRCPALENPLRTATSPTGLPASSRRAASAMRRRVR